MEKENLTPNPLPDKPAEIKSDSNVDVVKTALEKVLGKSFPDEATALKSVQDTFKAVSSGNLQAKTLEAVAQAKGVTLEQAQELIMETIINKPVVQQVDPTKFISKDQYDTDMFFSKNPQYATPEMRATVEAFQTKSGKPLAEVVQLPEFKSVFEKVAKVDEVERSRSVLHSNPRLGQAIDKVTESKDALKSGNLTGAKAAAVDAVIDLIRGQ